jgi:heme exporter protein D
VFPLDIYFDLKQSLAHATAWRWFAVAMILSLIVRSLTLAATLWLSEEEQGLLNRWMEASRLVTVAIVVLLPAAVFLFVGVGVRYAPFVWAGAALGVIPAVLLLRRVMARERGLAGLAARSVPGGSGYLSYVYVVAAIAAGMTLSARVGAWAPAALLVLSAPVHTLFLLGWREHARAGTVPKETGWAAMLTLLALLVIFGSAGVDRFVRDGGPPAPPVAGTLGVLGGVNSTSSTGALSDVDPRRVGFPPSRSVVLSYTRQSRYGEFATHGNLDSIARVVAAHVGDIRRPVDVIGHSQAALILDRILKMHLDAPDKAVLLAAPPPYPPSLTVPRSGGEGPGAVAADMARPLSRVFEFFGANGFNLDAPAVPFRLKRVEVRHGPTSRVAIWALGDSVWLEGDWRRRGETNVVATTDHVGVTNDPKALAVARDLFANRSIQQEGTSWASFAVNVLRYAFEPWRPG